MIDLTNRQKKISNDKIHKTQIILRLIYLICVFKKLKISLKSQFK